MGAGGEEYGAGEEREGEVVVDVWISGMNLHRNLTLFWIFAFEGERVACVIVPVDVFLGGVFQDYK